MAMATSDKIGKPIADLLGIKHCKSLTIKLVSGKLAKITAECNLLSEDENFIGTILKEFEIKEVISVENVTAIGDEVEKYAMKGVGNG